jgi:choline dehydrogenase
MAMLHESDDAERRFLANLRRRAAAGQIDRRAFLHLAAATGIGPAFLVADQAMAAPVGRNQSDPIAASYDYIVIGAGSAGCTLAARLSNDPACRVLLIEAGGADISRPALEDPVLWPSNFGTDVDWAYRTTPQPGAAGRVIEWPRGKVIGGSSSINAMIWVWGHAADFDHWAELGNQGWDYASLNPLFQTIETCSRSNANSGRGTTGPMHVEPLADPNPLSAGFFSACQELGHQIVDNVAAPIHEGAGYIDFNTKDGRRFSVVHGYLLPALERENLTLLTGVRVEALSFERRRCTGVRLQRGTERRVIVAAHETVLCAGVVESARLLMLSGVGDAEDLRRHGITVVSHLPGVGENLQDHCFIVGFAGETKLPIPSSRAGSHLFFRSTRRAQRPDIQAVLATSALGIAGAKPNEAFSIRLGLLRPQSRGRVQITSADPDAALLIDPAYLSIDSDVAALCAAIEHSRDIGSAAGLSKWCKSEITRIPRGKVELAEFVAHNVGSYWHPVGTCAMGVHREAVVDPMLRVHGTTNLRVADASIMPAITGGNTNAPTIAIAERAAQMIIRQSQR